MTAKVGDRVRLVAPMADDPDPIPVGSEGTVDWVGDSQLGVAWDNGRHLLLIVGVDYFTVIRRVS